MSFLESIDCQLEHCGKTIPSEDGDCCSGINENGKCVKGKFDSKKGVCVVEKTLSTKKILMFIGLILLFLLIIWAFYKFITSN